MEEEKRIAPVLASSSDPKKIGNTVSGLVMMIGSPIILQAISGLFGFAIPSEQISGLATNLGDFASQVTIAIGAVWAAYGALMKVVNRVNTWLVARSQ